MEPLGWRSPKFVFVNSMSDLFHPDVPDGYIVAVARVMMAANWHTYQVLTKRAERQQQLLNTKLSFASQSHHIWWGVSVEDRKHGLPRVEQLRKASVAVRFLSIEPLLEDLGRFNLADIHWAIVGGESGPGAQHGISVGGFDIRAVSRTKSAIFLQTMGRSTQKRDRARVAWSHL